MGIPEHARERASESAERRAGGGAVIDVRIGSLADGADPLNNHGGGRVAMPGEEERGGLEGGVVAGRDGRQGDRVGGEERRRGERGE